MKELKRQNQMEILKKGYKRENIYYFENGEIKEL